MSSEILTMVGVILLLILASAFFSSAETALTAASDARMRQLASKGNKRARLVERHAGADRFTVKQSAIIAAHRFQCVGECVPQIEQGTLA